MRWKGQRAEGSVEGRLTEQHDRRDAYERSVRNVAAGYFVKGPPMSYWDVFVIGAGPAGLTAGYLLTRQGLSTTLIEADPTYVGGISRTPGNKDFLFDISGHRFFSKSKEAQDLWKEILPNDFIERPRPRRSRRHPSAAVALRPGERGRSGARLCPLPGLDQARPLARAAGMLGYAAGTGLHYLLCVRFVFDASATHTFMPAR